MNLCGKHTLPLGQMDKKVFWSVAGEISPYRGASSGVFSYSQPRASLVLGGRNRGFIMPPEMGDGARVMCLKAKLIF